MTKPTDEPHLADNGPVELEAVVAALGVRFAVVTGAKQLVRRKRLDTFDRRLRAASLTLEHESLAAEDRFVLGKPDGQSILAISPKNLRWPALADELPAGPMRDTILPVTDIRALMVMSDEKRRVQGIDLHNADGKTVARVELDEPAASATSSGSSARLTVRGLRGYDKQARQATQLLSGFGLDGFEPDRNDEHEGTSKRVGTDREAPATELVTKALSAYFVAMRENLPGLLDNVDTEFLHDFRVAVRRSRATLKLGRPCLPEVMRSRWEPAFKGLGDLTTPVRDLDVYELDLPMMAGWLVAADPTDLEPFAVHLRNRRVAKRRALVRGLTSEKFQTLMTDWDEALAAMASEPDDIGKDRMSAGQLADRGISRAYRQVVEGGVAIAADSPAEDLHRLRKSCKNLRYALEVCAPVIASGPRKRAVGDLKGLQDVLGRFQDSEVQRQALHGFAEEMMAEGAPASAVLAMGELIGHLDAEQDRARFEFDGVFAHFVRPSSVRPSSRKLMKRLGGST